MIINYTMTIPVQSGRKYNQKNLKSAIDVYTELFINSKTSFGETPTGKDVGVNMKYISHLIKKITLCKNGKLEIEAQILDTPHGRALKTLYENGMITAVPRFIGRIDEEGNVDVFRLVSVDFTLKQTED